MKKQTLFAIVISIVNLVCAQEFNYLPELCNDTLVVHIYYTISYSNLHEQPKWVAYQLKPEMLQKVVARKDNFREDLLVPKGSAQYTDYEKSGYDAGHMLCVRNMQFSCEAMDETFYMSNMSPQHKDLNRIRWAHLEALERSMVERNGDLYVISGPILESISKTIGKVNKISVPKYFYKIILKHDSVSSKSIAFLLPNKKCPLPLKNYVVSVDSVEKMTSINFFPDLPDSLETEIESFADTINWSFRKSRSTFGYEKKTIRCEF